MVICVFYFTSFGDGNFCNTMKLPVYRMQGERIGQLLTFYFSSVFWQSLSAHKYREGIPSIVSSMYFSYLHSIVYQVVVDDL